MSDRILRGCAGINSALLLNYLLWYFGFSHLAPFICVSAIFICFAYLVLCVFRFHSSIWPIPFFILILLLISLSTPSVNWDARSIWLFHAKRIFFDDNLFAQLDNYAPWSHNDYPVIIPAFSASLARLMGGWNEIFPKTANIVFLISPLFLIGSAMRRNIQILLVPTLAILFCSHYLYDGYMDANIAFGLLATVLVYFQLQNTGGQGRNILIFVVASNLAILGLIKNEGVLLVVIFCILFLIFSLKFKLVNKFQILFVFVFSFLFVISWKYNVIINSVDNDLASGFSFSQILSRLASFESLLLLIQQLFFRIWFVPTLLLVGYLLYAKEICARQDAFFTILFIIIYILFVFGVYLATPNDLNWHLRTSARRVVMAVDVLSVFACLYAGNYFPDTGLLSSLYRKLLSKFADHAVNRANIL